MSAPSNALVGSIFFVGTLITDALTALDNVQHADVAASLRATGIVLACCFAAPVIKSASKGVSGLWQRPIAGALLLAAAIAGQHHGGARTRAFDAIYTTVVGLSVTWLFSAGGVDEMSRESAKGGKMNATVSTSSAMLAAALLFYSNARILRAGLLHSSEVRNFLVQPSGDYDASTAVRTLGYAHSSMTATVSVSAGAAAGIAAAVVMMRHATEFSEGTQAVSLPMGVAAAVQLLCALASSLSYGEQVERLSAIFGESACRARSDACIVAEASRRFAAVNTQAPGLWLSALGMFALAYPVRTRFTTQEEARLYLWNAVASIAGLVAACAALAIVYTNADFAGVGGHTDYMAMVVIFGIFWSFFWDSIAGTAAIVIAYAVEEHCLAQYYGARELFSHVTHMALVLTIVLLALHLVIQVVFRFYESRTLQEAMGTIAVAGSSIACALYGTSCCILISNNGRGGNLIDANDGAHFALAFVLQHFAPLFCWAPIMACRCELQLLTSKQRLAAWLGAPLLLGSVYGVAIAGLNKAPPALFMIDGVSLSGCFLGVGVVPWLAASSA